MYFWNIKKLKAVLIERPLTEREVLPYLIATALAYLLCMEVLTYAYTVTSNEAMPYGIADYAASAFAFAITVLGTVWIFKKNNINNENHFLQRYTALGWVVLIRVTSFFIAAIVLLLLALTVMDTFEALYDPFFESGIFGLLSSSLFYLIYYWYFGKHIADVAKKARY